MWRPARPRPPRWVVWVADTVASVPGGRLPPWLASRHWRRRCTNSSSSSAAATRAVVCRLLLTELAAALHAEPQRQAQQGAATWPRAGQQGAEAARAAQACDARTNWRVQRRQRERGRRGWRAQQYEGRLSRCQSASTSRAGDWRAAHGGRHGLRPEGCGRRARRGRERERLAGRCRECGSATATGRSKGRSRSWPRRRAR
mmetsp:Transcript_26912/g.72184  ORF Transcript_26912/g.72184 Transcript_26912/m.72184 type:complete len:201 (+) Transcript_26912:137-739(+)